MDIGPGKVMVNYAAHGTGRPVLVLHGAGVDHREAEACFEPAFADQAARGAAYPLVGRSAGAMARARRATGLSSTDDTGGPPAG